LNIIERIPRIWKRAYLYICLWYALNFALSSIIEWRLYKGPSFAFWNGLYLFEALCIMIALLFVYCHWLVRYKLALQITGHILGLITFFLIMGSVAYYFEDYLDGLTLYEHWREYMVEMMSWRSIRFQEQYIIVVGVFYGITYFEGIQKKENEKAEMALKNKEMQISLLKSQINPHFFFNTLNSLSTLVGSSKEKARKVITQLSDIFRYALDSHGDQKVRLIQEIEFIENYLRIQQVRFGDRLQFIKQIDPSTLGMQIPPMILQPLVENAVKYGIAPKGDGGTITLTIRRIPNAIYFEVKDDGLGINTVKELDSTSTGVGVKNTNQRLVSIYGPEARLKINNTDKGYTVSFNIPDKNTINPILERVKMDELVVTH
jgi:two-component system, LytTR family, sensor kinase